MTKLEELLYSLTRVVIRYHDTQAKKKLIEAKDEQEFPKKTRALARSIIKEKDYYSQLDSIIKDNGTYDRRNILLYFMIHEIKYMKEQLERTISFKPLELEEYKNKVTQLLIDIKALLNTKKSATYKVTHSNPDLGSNGIVSLNGMLNDSYVGGKYCNSGAILREELLGIFNNEASYTEEEIKEIAESICTEHQQALLVQELLAKNIQQGQLITEQHKVIDSSELRISEFQQKLSESQSKLSNQHSVTEVEQKLTEALKKIEQQKSTILKLETTISQLKQAPIQTTPTQPSPLQSTPIPPYPLGTLGFGFHPFFNSRYNARPTIQQSLEPTSSPTK